MDFHEFLRKMPKVELHCHLGGSVRASTLAELAAKNGVPLPAHDQPEDLYRFHHSRFFEMYKLVCHTLRERDDFRRVTYESLEDGAAEGLRYREMFWSPHLHMEDGLAYKAMVDGIIDGIHDVEKDLGVRCRMIADIPRYMSSDAGVELVEVILQERRDEVIGIGSDFEYSGPPQKLLPAYRLAKEGGLHRCGHAGQREPARNIEYCLDELGFERVDHGYSVLLDWQRTQRCAAEGVAFTVCPAISQLGMFPWDLSMNPVREMINRGIHVSIGSDDPAMIGSNIGLDYVAVADHMGYGPADFKRFVLHGLEGSWLDEATKSKWSREWGREIDELALQIEGPPGLRFHLDLSARQWHVEAQAQLLHVRDKY
jgi:adenosine deaminase